ncbi:MAG: hypothetical protein HC854_04070 [Flavobacterium sp.]|nr:hypothetical protein [Flavobacterium sp.]
MTNDYNYNFTLELPNGDSQFVSNDLEINLKIENTGQSQNNFKIKYISEFNGKLSFQNTNEEIPFNEYINVPAGIINLNYSSEIIGQQNVTFYCIDDSGNERLIATSFNFLSPSFDLTQTSNYSTTNGNNVLHEMFIENENIVNDNYQLKYEILSMNWIQDPAVTQTSPTLISGNLFGNNTVAIPLNTYIDITNSLTLINNKSKINLFLSYAGYSQFRIKITVKNSYNIEENLIFEHNGVFPQYNTIDFLLRYKRGYSIGSNNNYVTYTFCYTLPNVSGATLTNFKIVKALNNTNNYISVYSNSTAPNYNQNTLKGTYSDGFIPQASPFVEYYKYRILLTYSNGAIYWVDKGVNYDVDTQIGFGSAITNFINSACN